MHRMRTLVAASQLSAAVISGSNDYNVAAGQRQMPFHATIFNTSFLGNDLARPHMLNINSEN